MEPTIFFTVITAIYLMAFFFDCFFKSCMHYPYEQLLKNTGLTIGFLRFTWYTTVFNRTVLKWGSGWNRWLSKSFTVGVLVALILMPIGIVVLLISIIGGEESALEATQTKSSHVGNVKIEILLPGVNLPMGEIGFYITTLILSTVVHELGHALAAVLEDVPVTGFGFNVYFCLPIAYTEISCENLNSLKWMRKMRILCAGIWHNVLLSIISWLLLSTIGIYAAPFYITNESLIITKVSRNALHLRGIGDRIFMVGDVIKLINGCPVNDENSWHTCLVRSIRHQPRFCITSDFIRTNDESVDIPHHGSDGMLQCCDVNNKQQFCFQYVDDLSNEEPIEIPQHVCLNVRTMIDESFDFCTDTCEQGFCLRPLLRNTTTILVFEKSTESSRQKIVYIGHPGQILRNIKVSPYVPKTSFISSKWADSYTLFLKYNIVFSTGLALINAIPCFGLDGYHISSTIINSFLVNRLPGRAKRETIVLIVIAFGTVLFFTAIFKVLWISVLSGHF